MRYMFMDLYPQLVFSCPAKAVGPSSEAQGRICEIVWCWSDGVSEEKSVTTRVLLKRWTERWSWRERGSGQRFQSFVSILCRIASWSNILFVLKCFFLRNSLRKSLIWEAGAEDYSSWFVMTNYGFSVEFEIGAPCERDDGRVPLSRRGGLHGDRQDGLVQGQARTDVGAQHDRGWGSYIEGSLSESQNAKVAQKVISITSCDI